MKIKPPAIENIIEEAKKEVNLEMIDNNEVMQKKSVTEKKTENVLQQDVKIDILANKNSDKMVAKNIEKTEITNLDENNKNPQEVLKDINNNDLFVTKVINQGSVSDAHQKKLTNTEKDNGNLSGFTTKEV